MKQLQARQFTNPFYEVNTSTEIETTVAPEIVAGPSEWRTQRGHASTTVFRQSNSSDTDGAADAVIAPTLMSSAPFSVSSFNINPNNPFLSESAKQDDFLKTAMKICLVVSPPSNKLLQVRGNKRHMHALTYIERSVVSI